MHPADANEKKYPAHQSTSWWCARGNENQFSRCEGQKNKCLPTISRPRLLSGRANNIAAGTNPCARSLARSRFAYLKNNRYEPKWEI